ncbi:MAG: dTDP-4-dehydrorhamnose 3,5-epimerase [Chloroflexota bacterium]
MTAPTITEHKQIPGVRLAKLQAFADNRGRFTEIFRKEWFPQRNWEAVQMNRSESREGVLRGLHYHFNQVDYWYLLTGKIQVGLVDLRPSSPAHRTAATITLSADDNTGLFIPIGVAHGFLALTDVTLLYVVDNYYDGGDEFGLAWNDPEIGPAWNTSGAPNLSTGMRQIHFGVISPYKTCPSPSL